MKKVIMSAEDLQVAVRVLSAACASSPILTILQYIKIVVSQDNCTLTSSDLENTIETRIACTSNDEFSFCFPYNELKEIVSVVAGGIEMQYEEAALRIKVKTAYGITELPSYSTIDFPKLPSGNLVCSLNLDHGNFLKIKTALRFASTDSKNPALNGVCLDFIGESMKVVATDAWTLYVSEAMGISGTLKQRIILSIRSARAIASILEHCTASVLDGGNISFKTDDTHVYCRLIDQNYANYTAVIPDYDSSICVDKNSLISAIRIAMLSASKTTSLCRMTLADTLTIAAEDTYSAKTGKCDPIRVINNGVQPCEWNINGKQLLECISPFSEQLIIRTSGLKSKPLYICDADSNDFTLCQPTIF